MRVPERAPEGELSSLLTLNLAFSAWESAFTTVPHLTQPLFPLRVAQAFRQVWTLLAVELHVGVVRRPNTVPNGIGPN